MTEGRNAAIRREVHGNDAFEIAAVAGKRLATIGIEIAPESRASSGRSQKIAGIFGESDDVSHARQHRDGIQSLQVPNPDSVIVTAGGDAFAIDGEGEVAVVLGMQAPDFFHRFFQAEAPDFDRRTSAAAGNAFSVR